MVLIEVDYKLVLREPGKEDVILLRGSKKECEKKKIEYSLTYNSDWLVIEVEERPLRKLKFTFSGVISLTIIVLAFLYGKKIYIDD